MKKRVLINVEEKGTRLAVLEDDDLVELLTERAEDKTLVGNIYKGVVRDVVRGLSAAFVDIGLERNAFLHFDDFDPVALSPQRNPPRRSARSGRSGSPGGSSPADLIRPKNTIMVQVIKDEIGTKPPRLSTHVALAGRYLVLLPLSRSQGGISRKISEERERERLRKVRAAIQSRCPYAFIIRTAGLDQNEDEMKRDLGYLRRQWGDILHRYRRAHAPALIYNDHDFLYRAVRDYISSDTDEIVIDSRSHHRLLGNAVKDLVPSLQGKIVLREATGNIFTVSGVEEQIRKLLKRKVWLKSGGHVIFDEMEALTAIDVNTGKFISRQNQEETILKTNLEAARVVAHQLRLRDIGGLIVIDFIDMEEEKNRRRVLAEFRKHLARDKAKMSLTGFSEFGLIELTRQRVRQSLKDTFFTDCPYCAGSGRILAREEIWLQVKYAILHELEATPRPASLLITLHPIIKSYVEKEFASYLQNLGNKHRVTIHIIPSEDIHIEEFQIFRAEKKEDALRIRQDIAQG
jgi:ribonuclease G